MPVKASRDWPVLKTYDQEHLSRIALPLGGIGTGTVSLGGRGQLQDWEIVNRPAKGFNLVFGKFTSHPPFFALFAKPAGGEAVTRAIEGVTEWEDYESDRGCKALNHGLPRFRECSFAAAYPFGQVLLSDPGVPLDVRLEAFNPLIPADADRSGIPVAVLRFVLLNKTSKSVTASVCGSMPNFIGADGSSTTVDWRGERMPVGPKANKNRFKSGKNVRGIFMTSDGVDSRAEQWGTMALTTTAKTGLSHRAGWASLTWGDTLLDFWDDFSDDGELERRGAGGADAPMTSLAAKVRIPPRGSKTVTFLLTWHFPNRQTWTPKEGGGCCDSNRVGNYYTTQYRDAWDVAEKTAPQLPKLESDTVAFVGAFSRSDLPAAVKEAALFNLSTLRTQTCFRTEDGRFYGFEGCCDGRGCCLGSCTHVWNYEQATAFLFGDLAKSMREVEFLYATADNGLMSFRAHLPLERAQEQGKAAADGQMGCFMKLYRDWQLSGDDKFLHRLWPKVKKAMEFCWIPGGWDADQDGVMEGCQHNTMDVEYFGPNPQMGAWYLGALRATEEMARYVGDEEFASTCRQLFEKGSRWMDENLFNGEYYEHEVRPPKGAEAIAEGLRVGMGTPNWRDPDLQLGAGCLVDQLVGQYLAHVCKLGYLLKRKHVRATLRSIMKYNFKENLFAHFNHLRTFALNDESAILMASYPRGRRPRRPFPYFNEVMTGFEYSAAVHMLYEGQEANGLKCIAAIRDRYDGKKRSPFDEAECGHHYARAMASWAAVLALTGFHYSGVDQTIEFAAADEPTEVFWSNGHAWGTCRQMPISTGVAVQLTCLHGSLRIKRLVLSGCGTLELGRTTTVSQGKTKRFVVKKA